MLDEADVKCLLKERQNSFLLSQLTPQLFFCSLKAPKRFPHWTEDCPDATPAPTEATLEPTVATSEPTVATTTTVTTTTTPRPVVDTFSADGGQRRLLRRGRRG